MAREGLRYLGSVNGNFTATTGTINCSNAREVNLEIVMDVNSGYEVAMKPTTSAAGTASKTNFDAVVTDNGTYETPRPAGSGSSAWYIAYQVYNGAAAANGSTGDKYAGGKWG